VLVQPIDIFVYAWLMVALLCAAYVAWDQFSGNPEPAVMKWGFVLITLYMGPMGLLLYVMADKEPEPGSHEEFVKPLWKQGVGSTVHCVAGDATGIVVAATVTALIGFPMWVDLIVEYTVGFLFGLLIFQSLFMRKMMGGSYAENLRRSFLPELISMNRMMAGMAPVMINLMMGRDMRAMRPDEPLFWVVMSLGVVAGFGVKGDQWATDAYPGTSASFRMATGDGRYNIVFPGSRATSAASRRAWRSSRHVRRSGWRRSPCTGSLRTTRGGQRCRRRSFGLRVSRLRRKSLAMVQTCWYSATKGPNSFLSSWWRFEPVKVKVSRSISL
jgi:hypothetical protein